MKRAVQCAAMALACMAMALGLASCGGGGTDVQVERSSSGSWTWVLPLQFPEPRVPADNPMSAEKVALGRFLFYDRRLSGNGTQACGGCHLQSLAFTDGRAVAVGSTGEAHPRNAQTLGNVAYSPTMATAPPCWPACQVTAPIKDCSGPPGLATVRRSNGTGLSRRLRPSSAA
jgi:cytochrome c peroxidase